MNRAHPTNKAFRVRAWQIIAAAVILLTMPVNYRGGAELPHPHAFFQFWSSGDADAFDHHGHHHGEQSHRAADLALVDASKPASSIDPRPDTPLLSNLSWPGERADGLAIALLASLIGVAVSIRALRLNLNWSIPSGRRPHPDPPPPR